MVLPAILSLCFLGKAPLRLLKSLGIDLTALESHAATQSSYSAGRRAHAGINDQASHREQGFDVVDRLVQPLLPVVVVFVYTCSLKHVPNSLRKPAGPLPKDQERLPGIDYPLVVNPALPMSVDDRQAPDVAEVLGQVGDLTQVCLPDVSHEQSPRLQDS